MRVNMITSYKRLIDSSQNYIIMNCIKLSGYSFHQLFIDVHKSFWASGGEGVYFNNLNISLLALVFNLLTGV